jgi:hypothetical protein
MDNKTAVVITDQLSGHPDPDIIIEEFVKSDLGRALAALPHPTSPTGSEYTLSSGSDEDDFGSCDEMQGNTETSISPRSSCPPTPNFERPLSHAFNRCDHDTVTPCLFDHPGGMIASRSCSPRSPIVFPIPSPVPLTPRRPPEQEAFNRSKIQIPTYFTPLRDFQYQGYLRTARSPSPGPSTVPTVHLTPTRPILQTGVLDERKCSGIEGLGGEGRELVECWEMNRDGYHDDELKILQRLLWKRNDEKRSMGNDPFL